MEIHNIFWISFALFFIIVFTIDMYVTGHREGRVSVKTALLWSGVWISSALLFSIFIYNYFPEGKTKAFEFITSYIIEYSLSVDNLFVFILIFSVMRVREHNQPRILKWGIIGAIVLRIIFIIAGVQLITKFHFFIYIFGAVLIFTAIKMVTHKDEHIDPEKNIFVKLASRMFKIKSLPDSHKFFVRENGQLYATVSFITLILIESTDLIFAIDSIPAVLAITQDSFIAITSNLFAVLGLRSLFFALAGIINFFRYLKYGISFILFFIGLKMLISGWYYIPVQISLIVILVSLSLSIILSIIIKEKLEDDNNRQIVEDKNTKM